MKTLEESVKGGTSGKNSDVLGCQTCDVFTLSFLTQEKQIINSLPGGSTNRIMYLCQSKNT